jgi:sugar transferase (PEP-CTERM system associated)
MIESASIFLSLFSAAVMIDPGGNIWTENQIFLNILIITLICQTCLYYTDLYEVKISLSLKALAGKLLQALVMATIVLGLLYVVFPGLMVRPAVFAIGLVLMVIMVGSTRFCYSVILERGFFNQRIILMGSGDLAQKIIDEIRERSDCGYQISYVVLGEFQKEQVNCTGAPMIQKADYLGLCELAKEQGIRSIVVAIKEKRGNFPSEELLRCRVEGLKILDGNSFYEMLSGKLVVDQLYPSWLIFSEGFQKTLLNRFLKRTIDLALSLVMLVGCFPLMVVAAIAIKLDSKGPILFSQERVGRKHKPYRMYKFRSMINDAEKTCGPQFACEGDPRITRVGRVLRKLRFDEMPQLWNVLKGDMSFIGPRPERAFFVEQFEKQIPYYRERFSIKPGITGWAQICYRYGANAEDTMEKLNYDLFYIKNMSIFMDLMIVMKTIKTVLFGKGAR